MIETSINNNDKIFGYHPITPTIKIISAGKIKEPIVQDRFGSDVDDSELEHLGDIPLEVIYSRESDTYILLKGLCVFREGKQQKIKKFRCLIVGEVQLDHETIIGRLDHVFATIRPFHILEECRAIHQTVRLIEDTYTPGGNRRGKNYRKQSTIDVLCKHSPHKRSRIDILKRFGNHVGSLGIEGFFYLLKAEKKQLSLSLIHNANPILRNMKMRTKINHKIKEMQDKGSDEVEVMEEIGIMIYDVFFIKPISENIEKPKAIGDNESGGKDGKSDSVNSDPVGGDEDYDERSSIAEFYPVNRKVHTRVKKMFGPVYKKTNKVDSKYKPINELSSVEAEELWEEISDLSSALSKYKMVLYKAVFGK